MYNRFLWLIFILIFMFSGYTTFTWVLYIVSLIGIAFYYTGLYAFIHMEQNEKDIDDFFKSRENHLEQETLNMVCSNCLHLFFVFTVFHAYTLCIIIVLSVLFRGIINEKLVKELKIWQK